MVAGVRFGYAGEVSFISAHQGLRRVFPDWFELRSAAIMAAMCALLLTLVLASQYRTLRHVPGLSMWMAMAIATPVGLTLNNLQGSVPDWLAFPVGLTLLNVGLWSAWIGARQFSGRRPLRWSLPLVAIATLIWTWYFSAVRPSFGARSILLSAVQGWAAAHTAWLLSRIEEEDVRLPLRFASIPMGIYSMAAAARLVSAVWSPAESGFVRTPTNTLGYVVGSATMLCTYMGVVMAMSALATRDVRREADHDALTGLLNRQGLKRRFEMWRRRHPQGAAVLVDVDHLKRVNDTLGHAEGDILLAYLGQSITRLASPHTLACRLGGDEFAILAATTGEARAVADACALHFGVWCEKQYGDRLSPPLPSVSQGLAAAGPDLSSTLKAADLALYAAKSGGRNRIVEAQSGTGRLVGERELSSASV